ncbi:hypothetical protein TNCV_2946411 [Trichonephila clavipes]|nr:hypothetical protein TNCV_2946411 [Trichonephila clavipes]
MSRVIVHYPVGIWLVASAERMRGPPLQYLRDVELSVQCTGNEYQKGAAVKSNTTPNHDTGCRTNMVVHNATVTQPLTTVSLNSNSTIVVLQVEERFVSKHNVVPIRCPCPPFVTPSLVTQTALISS